MSAKERWDCCTEQPAVQHSAADDFLCPICLEVVSQATWLVAGNNAPQLYDRSCLIHWFEHGGRTCPATGLPLPNRVILRADPELQRRILFWAAEQGLVVPTSPSLGLSGPLAGGSGKRVKLLAGLRRQVRKALARLRKFFEESPKLYPALGDNSWAQRL